MGCKEICENFQITNFFNFHRQFGGFLSPSFSCRRIFPDFKKSSKGVLVDDIHEQIIIHNDVKQEPLFDTEEGKELIKPVDNDYARTLIQYELEKYKIVKGKPNRIVF